MDGVNNSRISTSDAGIVTVETQYTQANNVSCICVTFLNGPKELDEDDSG